MISVNTHRWMFKCNLELGNPKKFRKGGGGGGDSIDNNEVYEDVDRPSVSRDLHADSLTYPFSRMFEPTKKR
jgi:hypothetical protein